MTIISTELQKLIDKIKENLSQSILNKFLDPQIAPGAPQASQYFITDNIKTAQLIKSLSSDEWFSQDRPSKNLFDLEAINHICQNNSSLTQFKGHIDNAKAVVMAAALNDNTYLNELNLRGSNIDVEGGKAIAQMLKENTSITSLNLHDAFFYDDQDDFAWSGSECIPLIFQALEENNQTLKKLFLAGVDDVMSNKCDGITLSGATQIATTLCKNKTLEELDLSSIYFTPGSFVKISEALKDNTALKTLSLAYNHDVVTEEFVDALKKNHTLQQLDLTASNCGDAKMGLLADVLKVNDSLLVLDLSYNCDDSANNFNVYLVLPRSNRHAYASISS